MIDETELTRQLKAAAEHFELPADGPATITALATDPLAAPSGMGRPADLGGWRRPGRGRLGLVAAAVSVLVLSAALVSGMGRSAHPSTSAAHISTAPFAAPPSAARSMMAPAGPVANSLPVDGAPAGGPSLLPAGVGQPAKVVETGSLDLAYAQGRFSQVMSRVNALADGSGGFVASEQTSQDQAAPTATATLRVPTAQFHTVLDQLAGLGRVRSKMTSGQDVTSQYLDLGARIAALTLTRDQFDAILAKATSVSSILAVEAQIGNVQSQLDQLQGQQKLLDNQIAYATVSLTLSQAGAHAAAPAPATTGLGHAWHRAVRGFVDGFEAVVAGSGSVLFALLALAVVVAVGRLVWSVLRRRLL